MAGACWPTSATPRKLPHRRCPCSYLLPKQNVAGGDRCRGDRKYRESLAEAERSFSRDAQTMGIGEAFKQYGIRTRSTSAGRSSRRSDRQRADRRRRRQRRAAEHQPRELGTRENNHRGQRRLRRHDRLHRPQQAGRGWQDSARAAVLHDLADAIRHRTRGDTSLNRPTVHVQSKQWVGVAEEHQAERVEQDEACHQPEMAGFAVEDRRAGSAAGTAPNSSGRALRIVLTRAAATVRGRRSPRSRGRIASTGTARRPAPPPRRCALSVSYGAIRSLMMNCHRPRHQRRADREEARKRIAAG